MTYNQSIANKIRERLADLPNITEKDMMGGIAFMLNDKMCVGVIKDEMMCRIDPLKFEEAIEQRGCRPMDFTGRVMKGWIFVDHDGMRNADEFEHWIRLSLAYNVSAKKSKRK
jgi:TfoX/Sxy family transcriptional regulator of competence genes